MKEEEDLPLVGEEGAQREGERKGERKGSPLTERFATFSLSLGGVVSWSGCERTCSAVDTFS